MDHVIYKFKIPDETRPLTREFSFAPHAELIPFIPASLDPETVIGRTIDQVCRIVGTYGMGGPGFFGLRLGTDWLVVSIWGADEWILVNDRLVADMDYDKYGRPIPWIHAREDMLTPHLVGTQISSVDVKTNSLKIQFSNNSVLVIDPDSSRRPLLERSKRPREFARTDDLRRAVFLSPTIEIWV